MIEVGNSGENSMLYRLLDGRHVTILGKHKRTIITEEAMLTKVENKDWEEIKTRWANSYEIRSGVIFAEDNDRKTRDRAQDVESAEIETGTRRIKKKDLPKGVSELDSSKIS